MISSTAQTTAGMEPVPRCPLATAPQTGVASGPPPHTHAETPGLLGLRRPGGPKSDLVRLVARAKPEAQQTTHAPHDTPYQAAAVEEQRLRVELAPGLAAAALAGTCAARLVEAPVGVRAWERGTQAR